MAGTLTWLGHSAFRIDTSGRQARLRRSVPQRQPEVPRGRAAARARRHDPRHARARRPLRRHDRAGTRSSAARVAPVELADWLRGAGSCGGQGSDPEQGRHGGRGRESTSRLPREALSSSIADRYTGEPTGLVVSLEDGTRCTSPATRTSSATWRSFAVSTSRASRCCRSAITTRWGRKEAAVALELLGVEALRALPLGHLPAAHRHSRGAPRACTGRRGDRRRRARRNRSSYEGALARRHGAPRCRDRRRGRGRLPGRRARAGRSSTKTRCARRSTPAGPSSFARAQPTRFVPRSRARRSPASSS